MKTALLITNLGSPENADDVEPFLYDLFCDDMIINVPWIPQRWFAKMMARARTYYSSPLYRKYPSRLLSHTRCQARALSKRLDLPVFIGMRYGRPSLHTAMRDILRDGYTDVNVLNMSPQNTQVTIGTTRRFLTTHYHHAAHLEFLPTLSHDDGFIQLWIQRLRRLLIQFPNHHIFYSAHNIPKKFIDQGDPYVQELLAAVSRINAGLGISYPTELSYQSRSGPVRWLRPETRDQIVAFGKAGIQKLILVPISFTTDCLETDYEIDVLYAGVARKNGIASFQRPLLFNAVPDFIDFLADFVRRN